MASDTHLQGPKVHCTHCGFNRQEPKVIRHGQYGICPKRGCHGLMREPETRTFFGRAALASQPSEAQK